MRLNWKRKREVDSRSQINDAFSSESGDSRRFCFSVHLNIRSSVPSPLDGPVNNTFSEITCQQIKSQILLCIAATKTRPLLVLNKDGLNSPIVNDQISVYSNVLWMFAFLRAVSHNGRISRAGQGELRGCIVEDKIRMDALTFHSRRLSEAGGTWKPSGLRL